MEKKRKPRKELPTVLNVILLLLFVIVFVFFGICIGFFIDSFLNPSIYDIKTNLLITLLVGIVYMTLLLVLICNSDSENVKPFKWYLNCVLISLTITLIITALTVFTLQPDNNGVINYLVGFLIFPFIGIISTPNIVKYVNKDTVKWKNIFYDNGNLEKIKNSDDFYYVKNPVPFEKKLLKALYKNQFLNVLVVIAFMLFVIFIGVRYMSHDHSYTENVVMNLMTVRAKRAFGLVFFFMIIFLAFGIPIIAFYVSNALKKIRVVKNHEYIAYHAIVSGVRNGKINIYNGSKYYKYNYCTCVGIKEKNVHFIKATLIFVPDDVFLFPDTDEYKVTKYKRKK